MQARIRNTTIIIEAGGQGSPRSHRSVLTHHGSKAAACCPQLRTVTGDKKGICLVKSTAVLKCLLLTIGLVQSNLTCRSNSGKCARYTKTERVCSFTRILQIMTMDMFYEVRTTEKDVFHGIMPV